MLTLKPTKKNLKPNELNSIIDELDDTYRLPFVMFYQGFKYEEIAEAMDLPIGTINPSDLYRKE